MVELPVKGSRVREGQIVDDVFEQADYFADSRFLDPGKMPCKAHEFLKTLSLDVNTTRQPGSGSRLNLLGYGPDEETDKIRFVVLGNGDIYTARMDSQARKSGIEDGLDSVYLDQNTQRLLEAMQEAVL